MGRRFGIGAKLAVIYLLLVVPLTTVLAWSYYTNYRYRVEDTLDQRADVAQLAGATFRLFVHELHQTEDILGGEAPEVPAVRDNLEVLTEEYPVSFAVALDMSGTIVASTDDRVSGRALRRHPAFASLLSGGAEEQTLTPSEEYLGGRGFFVARRVRSRHGARWLIGAFVDVGRLHDAFPFALREVPASIVDPAGRVIYQTEYAHLAAEGASWNDYAFVRTALRGGHGRTSTFRFPIGDQTRLAAAEPISGWGWAAASSVDREQVLGPVRRSLLGSAAWATAACLIALLVSLLVLRSFLGPLGDLVHSSRQLGEGDLASPLATSGRDEIGDVARTLEQTRARLRRYIASLDGIAGAARELSRSLDLDDVLEAVTAAGANLFPDRTVRLELDESWGDERRVCCSFTTGGPRASNGWVSRPLMTGDEALGTLYVSGADTGRWEPGGREAELLQTFAVQASLAIRNARTFQVERDVAETLQRSMLSLPERVPGLAFDYVYKSASQAAFVGGDFFDLIELPGDRLGVLLGDVSGKGLVAATLTALVKNTVNAYAVEHRSPAKVVSMTNEVFLTCTDAETFVTLFFGVLDLSEGTLTYCSAGHPPALVLRSDGGLEALATDSPLVGALAEVDFREHTSALGPGERLVLYTDGVIELPGPDGERYGNERLTEVVPRAFAEGVSVAPLMAALDEFGGGVYGDDVAVLALSPTGSAARSSSPVGYEGVTTA